MLRRALRVGLPADFIFLDTTATPPVTHAMRVTTEGGRMSLIKKISASTLRMTAQVRRSHWVLPFGTFFHSVHSVAAIATPVVLNYSQDLLLGEARRLLHRDGSVTVVTRSAKNTSRLERKWRVLNKFRPTLLQMPPLRFDLHVLHILDSQNRARVLEGRAHARA